MDRCSRNKIPSKHDHDRLTQPVAQTVESYRHHGRQSQNQQDGEPLRVADAPESRHPSKKRGIRTWPQLVFSEANLGAALLHGPEQIADLPDAGS